MALYDTFPEDIDIEEPLFASIDSLAVPLYFEEFTPRGATSAVVRFADINTPERAAELIGLELYMQNLTEEESNYDEGMYMEDMVGFTARFKGHTLKGTITDFIYNELNPLFEAEIEERTVLIPANIDFIDTYNARRKSVTFNLPEGLLELNG